MGRYVKSIGWDLVIVMLSGIMVRICGCLELLSSYLADGLFSYKSFVAKARTEPYGTAI